MCGIFGHISNKHYHEEKSAQINSYLNDGISILNNRGPDYSDVKRFQNHKYIFQLGHTRLAIIDLQNASNQPYFFDNLVITYNGEIYNYIELRNILTKKGYKFETSSDTEVLIKSWHCWGSKALSKLNGMFSFVIFDKSKNQLYLVRDRFGVKPLFFYLHKEYFLFSSSASHLAEHVKSNIDDSYISRALRYKVFETKASESPFKEISSVNPGEYVSLDFNINRIVKKNYQWYDLKSRVLEKQDQIKDLSLEEISEYCYQTLNKAVNIRLRSDVPVAVSLSGGLDSSSIASIASEKMKNLEGFTYGDPQNKLSEGPLVKKFSNDINISTNFIWPRYKKNDLEKMFYSTLSAQEAPFGGLSVMAQFEVYKNVKKNNFKVLLGGQGGDEVFGGYRKFFLIALRESIKDKNYIDSLNYSYSLFRIIFSEIGFIQNYFTAFNRYSSNNDSHKLLSFKSSKINLWGSGSLSFNERQIDDIQKWSLPTLLRFEDRNSMANSVESRLPFMDYNLVELGLAILTNQKIRNGYGKWILRKSLYKKVPNYIRLDRKKRGFDVTSSWISDGLGEILIERVFDNRLKIKEFLRNSSSLDQTLNLKRIENDKLLLDEVLMANWLINPYKRL